MVGVKLKDILELRTKLKASRKGSNRKRKGAQSFATGGFNKTMNAVTGMVNSKPVMNTLKKYTGTQDQRNQSVIEDYNKQQEKESRAKKAQDIKSMKGSRKGCLECKGSRPDNLNQIALNISDGRKRSLHLNDISNEESRKGSRKGEPGDTDESNLFIYLYEQDTTDNATLRNRWNILSDDEKEYILFQFGESIQEFEETFK